MPNKTITTYNEKGFLLPDSINSVACYHAKIKPDGVYMFRLHDCNTGAKLIGTVTNDTDIREAIDKLRCLEVASGNMANFIEEKYLPKP